MHMQDMLDSIYEETQHMDIVERVEYLTTLMLAAEYTINYLKKLTYNLEESE